MQPSVIRPSVPALCLSTDPSPHRRRPAPFPNAVSNTGLLEIDRGRASKSLFSLYSQLRGFGTLAVGDLWFSPAENGQHGDSEGSMATASMATAIRATATKVAVF